MSIWICLLSDVAQIVQVTWAHCQQKTDMAQVTEANQLQNNVVLSQTSLENDCGKAIIKISFL